MRKLLPIYIFFFCTLCLHAQEGLYEQMKVELNEQSLPLVNMTVDVTALNKTDFVPGEIEITDYYRRTDPESETVRYPCKYRIRGGISTVYEKKSFAVKLYDDSGKDLDANIFGIREENSWILDAMANDRIRMRNRVCFDLWNEMGHTPYDTKYDNRNGTKGVFVEVFVNGDYHGLYCMTDKIDRKLLGLKKAKEENGEVTIKGLLYKCDNWSTADSRLVAYGEADTNTDRWNTWELQYPDEYPSIATWQPLMNLIDFCSSSTPNSVFLANYRNYFYYENLLEYLVLTFAMNIRDNLYKNTYLSVVDITKAQQFLISPWDMDMSLGGTNEGGYLDEVTDINRYYHKAPFNRLIERNLDHFKDSTGRKWNELYATVFSEENVSHYLDLYAEQFVLSGAWQRERSRWNDNPVPLQENIYDELDYVKNWYSKNHAYLCAEFKSDITTSIEETARQQTAVAHTLVGHRVDVKSMQKGIYVIDGKKVAVR